ncbi:O-antigen ligase family protein [Nocardia altamirensis]|uniref:O-antigen ligase family protein n=1 Tax=Nocardia altamirensis TaxID=472158 RepID=UPI00083FF44C|nr:O-antigen ligase family protein [Nocardia altamirensis]
MTRGGVGSRADVWVAGISIAGEHPLGVGPGRAGAHLNERTTGPETYQHAHNLWLNYAIEAGVAGLCVTVAITIIGAWIAVEASRIGSHTAPAAGAGLAGFVIMNLADTPSNNQRLAFMTAIVLGVLIVRRTRPQPPPRPRAASMFDVTMELPRVTVTSYPTPRERQRNPRWRLPRRPAGAEQRDFGQ